MRVGHRQALIKEPELVSSSGFFMPAVCVVWPVDNQHSRSSIAWQPGTPAGF